MSKSDPDPNGAIYFSDTNDQILKKIKRSVTDSGTEITYDDQKPGVKNLINIQAAILNQSPQDIVNRYAGKQYGHLKVETAEIVVQELGPIRDKMQDLVAQKDYLDMILKRGADRARQRAQKTLAQVYERLGLVKGRY
jgi:tryptophanyl-tRNA synthetase